MKIEIDGTRISNKADSNEQKTVVVQYLSKSNEKKKVVDNIPTQNEERNKVTPSDNIVK